MIEDWSVGRPYRTRYQALGAGWQLALRALLDEARAAGARRLVALVDPAAWAHHGAAFEATLDGAGTFHRLEVPPGEGEKSIETVLRLLARLSDLGFERRDLIVGFGGGVCCDVAGFVALLYMRGVPYALVPTSLMAQVDAAIGGKVGCNFAGRKNLLGGFHHPLGVIASPDFLASLPERYFRAGIAEAIKLALIGRDGVFESFLRGHRADLLRREPRVLEQVVATCMRDKLALLGPDPFEHDLSRVLNLGHAVAHAIEDLDARGAGSRLHHGEAVAVGIASVTRYARGRGLCPAARAQAILALLAAFDLPTSTSHAPNQILTRLAQVVSQRGGTPRLVVPAGEHGVTILDDVDLESFVSSVRSDGLLV